MEFRISSGLTDGSNSPLFTVTEPANALVTFPGQQNTNGGKGEPLADWLARRAAPTAELVVTFAPQTSLAHGITIRGTTPAIVDVVQLIAQGATVLAGH